MRPSKRKIMKKMNLVSNKIEELGMSSYVMVYSISMMDKLEKAYNLIKEKPEITKDEYLEAMNLSRYKFNNMTD